MSVQNYTCYNSDSGNVAECFGREGDGIYLNAVTDSGTSCSWKEGDAGYWAAIRQANENSPQKIYGMVNASGSLTSLEPMVACMKEGTKTHSYSGHTHAGIEGWDGAFIDYEHGSSCPSLEPLRTYLGPAKPIYVYTDRDPGAGADCYFSAGWNSDPHVIPVYPCYGGSTECGPDAPPSKRHLTNSPRAHYIYQSSLPPSGSYDLYVPSKKEIKR